MFADTPVLVDAHVHLHDCFDHETFLRRAAENFRRAAHKIAGSGSGFIGVLCFTDGRLDDGFSRLRRLTAGQDDIRVGESESWSVEPTSEDESVSYRIRDDERLIAVAGRQVVTSENLEVLAIGTCGSLHGGLTLERTVHAVVASGALPILPWGFGKWTGERGRLLRALMKSAPEPSIFLGDSGNRPAIWWRPALFQIAEGKGIRNLPGSDPLPFPSEAGRAGSFGFVLTRSLNMSTPARDLKDQLADAAIEPYGRGERPLRFLRNQLTMQVRKHAPATQAGPRSDRPAATSVGELAEGRL